MTDSKTVTGETMQTEYPPHVPLTFHRGSVTNGNGQELPNEAYLTYGSAAAMNDKDAEVEIHGGGAHEAARMIDAAPDLLEALRDLITAVEAEVNEKGGGGFILARLTDARDAVRKATEGALVDQ